MIPQVRDHSGHRVAEVGRYLLVGSVSFLLDVGIIWLTYTMIKLTIAQATVLGFMSGLGFNFAASKAFTFRIRSDTQGQTVRYATLLGVNLLVTLIIVSASETWGPGYLIGKLCAVSLITDSNYFALGHWVFVSPRRHGMIVSSRLAKDDMQNVRED